MLNSTRVIATYIDTTLMDFSEYFDDGNDFNASTGVFTVPSSGLYHFTFTTAWDTPGPSYTDIYVIQRIAINGFLIEQINSKVSLNNYLEYICGSYDLKLQTVIKFLF